MDHILKAITGDATLFVKELTVWLPYSNRAGIGPGDDLNTVRKKLRDSGLTYHGDDWSVTYGDNELKYVVLTDGKDNAAERLTIGKDPARYREGQFEAYCAKVPGGYFLENGDYVVITERCLVWLRKNNPSVMTSESMAGARIVETEEGLRCIDSDGTVYWFSDDGIPMPIGRIEQ